MTSEPAAPYVDAEAGFTQIHTDEVFPDGEQECGEGCARQNVAPFHAHIREGT